MCIICEFGFDILYLVFITQKDSWMFWQIARPALASVVVYLWMVFKGERTSGFSLDMLCRLEAGFLCGNRPGNVQ